MYNFYVVKIKYFNEIEDQESICYNLYSGTSFVDISNQIKEDWGEDDVWSIEINKIEDGSLAISESLADGLVNDIPALIPCCKSSYRLKREEEKNEYPF